MQLKFWTNTVWPYSTVAFGACVFAVLVTNWNVWPEEQKLVAAIYVLVPFHTWEEWRLPGGFAYQYNLLSGSLMPDRYPMNQLTDTLTISGAMCFGTCLLVHGVTPAILISQAVFALAKVAMHLDFGVRMRRRFWAKGKRSIYNPGLATAVLGLVPILARSIALLLRIKLAPVDFLTALVLSGVLGTLILLPKRLPQMDSAEMVFDMGYYSRFADAGRAIGQH